MIKAERKKEKLWFALLKAVIFIAIAILIYFWAVKYEKDSLIRDDSHMLSPVPIAAPKPVLASRVFEEVKKPEPNVVSTVLEEGEPVGDEYFADALFAGDSLTDGFRIYDVGQHFHVISKVGLSPGPAVTEKVYKAADGEMLTISEAIKYLGARKVYILLGTNGLGWASPEKLVSDFSKLIDQFMVENPDTYIIIESIPPVTSKMAASRPSYVREQVEYYNSLLKDLAVEKGIYFLDVYSVFLGEDGYLLSSVAAGDGYHITPSGYKMWFEYITTHTIRGNSAFTMDNQGRIIPMKPVEDEIPEESTEGQEETNE